MTQDPGAEQTVIQVGRYKWTIDLAKTGLKQILEVLVPFTDLAELVTDSADLDEPEPENPTDPDADTPDDDRPIVPAAVRSTAKARKPTSRRAAKPAKRAAPTLTDEERDLARAWGKINWRQCGLKKMPGGRGKVHAVVVECWIAAGRPAVVR